jgi:predicted helicase
MDGMIKFYNEEVDKFNAAHTGLDKKARSTKIDGFVSTDPRKISWSRGLKNELAKNRRFSFDSRCLATSLYRPFQKQWLYFNRTFNEMVLQIPRIFPEKCTENRVIGLSASESRSAFSVLMSDQVPSLHAVDMVGSQYFPLYLYDEAEEARPTSHQEGLFDSAPDETDRTPQRRDALTDEGFGHFQAAYPGEAISKEDIFYYVYGLLHSPDYRERYADNLGKELPRIPCVKTAADFWAFSKAGRELAEWHLNYETVTPYSAKIDTGGVKLTDADYRVEKMRFGKAGKDKDRTTVIYNHKITVTGIPLDAYDYVVNGKPAIEWVMERQCVKTDKASGIVNDANDWAIETMHNPRYPLELLLRVVTVSLETQKIVSALPALELPGTESA